MAIHGSFPPSAAFSALACMAGFPFMVLSINLFHVSKGVCSLDDLSAIAIAPFPLIANDLETFSPFVQHPVSAQSLSACSRVLARQQLELHPPSAGRQRAERERSPCRPPSTPVSIAGTLLAVPGLSVVSPLPGYERSLPGP